MLNMQPEHLKIVQAILKRHVPNFAIILLFYH
ncbi:hypothetical protein EDC44_104120 [Cricetibacter osteomyelitidis]|uniref:Uncharacterized protein n=1 Tax=Cricetibacter osteomyelitidis TaxID=1521931 RepID=A0A4R2T127_9PAST|nr:hypothetical protein EDC44_104120 [Cricetibacter osteomyelitidis]